MALILVALLLASLHSLPVEGTLLTAASASAAASSANVHALGGPLAASAPAGVGAEDVAAGARSDAVAAPAAGTPPERLREPFADLVEDLGSALGLRHASERLSPLRHQQLALLLMAAVPAAAVLLAGLLLHTVERLCFPRRRSMGVTLSRREALQEELFARWSASLRQRALADATGSASAEAGLPRRQLPPLPPLPKASCAA
eukprot:TRINITY_DN3209_c0_g1_i1.p1 TRINITY_DN3209_c0_g1~~TRINITY_DN3209_c0_g1_i1.p1  ORF type:complete len:229 (+),score=56.01 TRINITY_DN3209_c0_g1_i1:81-689(+)